MTNPYLADFLAINEEVNETELVYYSVAEQRSRFITLHAMIVDYDLTDNDGLITASKKIGRMFEVPEEAVLSSIKLFPRTTPKDISMLAWKIVGNAHVLRDKRMIPAWSPTLQPIEWCLIELEAADQGRLDDGRRCSLFSFRLYSGAGAGNLFQQRLLLGKDIGIGHRLGLSWKKAEMLHTAEFAGLQGYACLRPARDNHSSIFIRQLYATAGQRKQNTALVNDRLEGECPHGFKPKKYKTCVPCSAAREKGELICKYALRRYGV